MSAESKVISQEGLTKEQILAIYAGKLAPQPVDSKVPLFPHQLYNIQQMRERERTLCIELSNGDIVESRVGILGDPPGTGKTKTAVFAIKESGLVWPQTPFFEQISQVCSNVDGTVRIIRKKMYIRTSTTLIVTGASILTQWITELYQAGISYKAIRNHHDFENDNVFTYSVLICVDTMYNDFANKYAEYAFKAFYFDEMDSIYIPNMVNIVAGHYWLISATFSTVIQKVHRSRNMHFLKKIFDRILSDQYEEKDLIQTITVLSPEDLRDLQPLPDTFTITDYRNEGYHLTQTIYPYVSKEIVSLIDSGKLKDIAKKIHRTTTSENPFTAVIDSFRARSDEIEEKIRKYQGKEEKKRICQEWLEKKEEHTQMTQSLHRKVVEAMKLPCPCCQQKMRHPQLALCCFANYCLNCSTAMLTSVDSKCPLCKKNCNFIEFFEDEDDQAMYDPEEEGDERKAMPTTQILKPKGKLDHLEKIIREGKKILIFSSSDGAFEEITSLLLKVGKSYNLFTGASATREKILRNFQDGKLDCIIMKDQSNSSGMNLQCATDIVLWNYMSGAFEKQAIGRAIRYGLDHQVNIHRFAASYE